MSAALPPVCLLVGGRGTRLGSITDETPKPLLPVGGRPFLEHVLEGLAKAGARRVVLSTGYLSEQFERALGDGSRFGLDLRYVEDGPQPAGTAGGVRNCLPMLGDRFIVMYGDSLLRADPSAVVDAHVRGSRLATMAVLPAAIAPEPPNCVVIGDSVIAYAKNPRPEAATHIDYGMLVFERAAHEGFDGSDLAALQSALAARGELTACVVDVPYTEIGTPDSLERAQREFRAEEPA